MHQRKVGFRRYVGWRSAGMTAALGLIAAAPQDALAGLQGCTVATTAVNFGAYDPLSGSPTDATGTVTVSCEVLIAGLFVSFTVDLSGGSSGSYAPRQLRNGTDALNYNLYTTAAHTQIWGDGTGGTGVVSDTPFLVVGSESVSYTAYGRLFAGQDRPAGSYSDTIIVTVIF